MANGDDGRTYEDCGDCKDLTQFWLAWRETCSIRKCLDTDLLRREIPAMTETEAAEVASQAKYVRRESNHHMGEAISSGMNVKPLKRAFASGASARGIAISEYIDLVAQWRKGGETGGVMAFELIEADFYAAAERDAESGEPLLKGKKWKDYLFEDIATRSGGMNRNLCGYLIRHGEWNRNGCGLSRLQMVAKKSFRGSAIVRKEPQSDLDAKIAVTDPQAESGLETVQNREMLAFLRAHLEAQWNGGFDRADKVAICGIFGAPAFDAEIARIAGIGLSALYRRRDKWVKRILGDFLKDECGAEAGELLWLVRDGGCEMVRKLATEGKFRNDACSEFYAYLDRKIASR